MHPALPPTSSDRGSADETIRAAATGPHVTRFGHHPQNDRWITESVFPGLRDGFFVEAGACGGMSGSASLALERDLGWQGICVEPLDFYYRILVRNRSCQTDHRCLSAKKKMASRCGFCPAREDRARSGIEALNESFAMGIPAT